MRIRSIVSNTLVLTVAFARLAAAQRAESSIAISAAIAAPVAAMSPDALAPQLQAPNARLLPAARPRPLVDVAPASQAARARPSRYSVRLRLDSAGESALGSAIVVRDADDRERLLERGTGVTIARGASAAEAQAAVVRLRMSGTPAPSLSGRAVHLVYEVTSESALTM